MASCLLHRNRNHGGRGHMISRAHQGHGETGSRGLQYSCDADRAGAQGGWVSPTRRRQGFSLSSPTGPFPANSPGQMQGPAPPRPPGQAGTLSLGASLPTVPQPSLRGPQQSGTGPGKPQAAQETQGPSCDPPSPGYEELGCGQNLALVHGSPCPSLLTPSLGVRRTVPDL